MTLGIWSLAAALSLSAALPGFAQSYSAAVTAQINDAKEECASFNNGVLDVPQDAVQQVDLTGNGIADDWAFDYSALSCSSAASLYCGTGGCSLDLIVADTITNRLAKGWSTLDAPNAHVVLLQLHGGNCGGTNMNPCFEALVWDDAEQRFYSLAQGTN